MLMQWFAACVIFFLEVFNRHELILDDDHVAQSDATHVESEM